jgi:hypothetical protein
VITHTIAPYKKSGVFTVVTQVVDEYDTNDYYEAWYKHRGRTETPLYPHQQWDNKYQKLQPAPLQRFDKLGYAQYITKLGLKKGDWVVAEFTYNAWAEGALPDRCIYEVMEVQEIHFQPEYTADYIPRCVMMRALPYDGIGFWSAATGYYVIDKETRKMERKL